MRRQKLDKKIARQMLRMFLLLVIFLFFGLFFARLLERRALYFPEQEISFDPSSVGLKYEDIYFKASDGVKLHGWFVPAEGAYATVLYFHGNAGNIGDRVQIAKMFYERKINFFIIDYRGFGRSRGSADEQGTYLDGLAAYQYLIDEKHVPSEKIVLYGKSLGVAIAVNTAVKVRAGALICESGFTSTRQMAKELYKFIPLWLFIGQKYDTLGKIDQIKIPKLIIHSQNDEIVPFSHGQRLFARAQEPKRFYVMSGGHNDAFYIYNQEVMGQIEDFLVNILK